MKQWLTGGHPVSFLTMTKKIIFWRVAFRLRVGVSPDQGQPII
jgi:hypothetical protein